MKAAVIDLETTGLLKHPRSNKKLRPKCIEFGAVVIDENGRQLDSMEQLIYPGQKITETITKITGITNEDLAGKPYFAAVAKDIVRLIKSCDVLIAHNLPFDKGVLEIEFDQINISPTWPKIDLCTVQENVPIYGYRIKLKDLYRDVTGKSWTQNHRALDDCMALAEVVMEEGYLDRII